MRSPLGGRLAALFGLLVSSAPLVAQAPSTDVWLAPLSRVGDSLVVGTPRNLTNRPGYDNQPSFTPDSKAILYTSTREDGQADIYRYDIAGGAITRLTSTPESEYSATVTPDGKYFSVVRVERDSTQRLWKFPLAGGAPSLVLQHVKPVGYHAWVDDSTLALFVLGQPARLVMANVRTGSSGAVAARIGRGLAVDSYAPHVLFVQQRDSMLMLSAHRPHPGDFGRSTAYPEFRSVVVRLPQNEFFALADDRTVLSATGTRVLAWPHRMDLDADSERTPWRTLIDLSGLGLRNITRLAVSADGRWLAFVAEASAP